MNSQEDIWNALLELRNSQDNENQVIGWSFHNRTFKPHNSIASLLSSDAKALLIRSNTKIDCVRNGWSSVRLPYEDLKLFYDNSLSVNIIDILKLYAPLSVMHFYKKTKPFVIVHVAASLDGKIATQSGDSKWIGNQENLVHSHRLRALVDGVLVGACTVKNDKPSLNVRHVKGKNPTRLVISNHSKDFSGLKKVDDSKSFLVRDKSFKGEERHECFDEIIYYTGKNQKKKVENLMLELYDKGIKSILIEGGSETISNLFYSSSVNVFQVHYAPIILGSGKGIVDLPLIDRISDAASLKNSFWTKVGDSFMITAGL